ncbi:hypothetical protein F4778DRAFT_721606 [Xylariomycetidae sp. FL2044]|nr:hypothetical protein F4778DRAFT_721606 [Xylariomycetidae sp. FL2044]
MAPFKSAISTFNISAWAAEVSGLVHVKTSWFPGNNFYYQTLQATADIQLHPRLRTTLEIGGNDLCHLGNEFRIEFKSTLLLLRTDTW